MADTFDSRLKLRLQESGGNSGQWGTLLNQTVTNIASVFGYGTHQLTSDADATLTLSDDGASIDALKSSYLKITSSVSLTATRTITFAPNTLNQVKYIENATSGSQSITISQGSGASITIESGATKVVYFDGAGSGAAVVDALANIDQGTAEFDTIKVATIQANDGTGSATIANSTGVMTIASSVLTTTDINGGTIDNAAIGSSTPAAGSFTTLSTTGNISSTADIVLTKTGTNDAGIKFATAGANRYLASDENGVVAIGTGTTLMGGTKYLSIDSGNATFSGSVTAAGLTSSTSIQTTGSSSYFISNSSSSGDYIRLYAGSGTGKWDIYGNGANLRIGDNDSAGSVVIDTNVGLGGQTNPQAKLDIKGDTSSFAGMSKIYLTDTSSNAARRNWAIGNGGSAYGNFTIGVSNAADGDPMAVGTHTTPFIITSGGNVGIGVSSPQAKLHSYTSGTGAIPTGQFNQTADDNTALVLINANNSATYSAIKLETRETQAAGWMIANEFQSAFNGDLVFRGRDGGSSSAEVLRLKSSGSVDISGSATMNGKAGTSPIFEMINNDNEDTDTGRETSIRFSGHRSGGEDVINAQLSAHHDGSADDDKGMLFFYTNNGGGLNLALKIDSSGHTYPGSNGAADLGLANNKWKDIYADGTLYIGGRTSAVGTADLVGYAQPGNTFIETQNTTTGTTHYAAIFRKNDTNSAGSIQVSNTATAYVTSSDYRLKTDVTTLEDGLQRVKKLKPVKFNWVDDGTETEGFIAHEIVEAGWSEGVMGEKDAVDENGNIQPQQVDYGRITPLLVKAIQEQQTLIETLQAEVAALKGA